MVVKFLPCKNISELYRLISYGWTTSDSVDLIMMYVNRTWTQWYFHYYCGDWNNSYLLSSCKRVLRLSIKPEVFTYTGWHPSIAVLLLKSAEARCVWSGIEYNVYSDLKLFLHPTIQGVRMLLVLMTKILHLWRISWMTSWSGMY